MRDGQGARNRRWPGIRPGPFAFSAATRRRRWSKKARIPEAAHAAGIDGNDPSVARTSFIAAGKERHSRGGALFVGKVGQLMTSTKAHQQLRKAQKRTFASWRQIMGYYFSLATS